jgi:hypothetical protein
MMPESTQEMSEIGIYSELSSLVTRSGNFVGVTFDRNEEGLQLIRAIITTTLYSHDAEDF